MNAAIVKLLPVWKTWIKVVVPYIEGNRVLEASFGTGYLLLQYANEYETHGIDINNDMIEIAKSIHPQTKEVMTLNFVTVEVLEIENGKVSVIRKYSE